MEKASGSEISHEARYVAPTASRHSLRNMHATLLGMHPLHKSQRLLLAKKRHQTHYTTYHAVNQRLQNLSPNLPTTNPTMTTTNPRTLALSIFLFLASALVTLTIKSSHWHSFIPNVPGSHNHQPNSAHHNGLQTPKVAFATFLAANTNAQNLDNPEDEIDDEDGYYLGTRVLAYQLLHSRSAGTNSSIPFIVLCTEDVLKRKRARLEKDGAIIRVVDRLNADWVHPGSARWADVLAKLRLFEMTEWSKILFIDADHLVTARLDGVFYDEATLTQPTLANPEAVRDDESALPRTYMLATHADFFGYEHPYPPPQDASYLNCGFFVFSPSKVLFSYYASLLSLPGRFDPGFPEQNLLNYAHRREGNMPWKALVWVEC
jgi:alpha-N-acetylglucosamine transferase